MHYPRLKLTVASRSRLTGVLFVVAAMILWSTVPVGTRLLVRDGGTFSAAFLSAARLWLAALVFITIRVIYARRHGLPFELPVRRTGWLLIAAGAICANYLLYAIGLRYTTAGATSIVSQVHPVITVLLAALLLGERLTGRKLLGMAAAITGVMLVVFHAASLHDLVTSRYFHGNLIEVMAALAWPFYAIGQTKLLEENGDKQVLMPIFVIAALLMSIMLPLTGPLFLRTPSVTDWLVLVFLGLGSTAAAYWLFAAGLQRLETSEGAMFNVLMPPFTLLLASWLLNEHLHANLLTALLLVVAGLVLIVWRRDHSAVRRRHPHKQFVPAMKPRAHATR